MHIFLFSLFLVYLLVVVILGMSEIKKLKNDTFTENVRTKFYVKAIIMGWSPVLIFISICLFLNIRLYDIGFRLISLNHNIWFNSIIFIISGVSMAFFMSQMILLSISKKHTEAVKINFDQKQNYHNVIVPRSRKEKNIGFLFR